MRASLRLFIFAALALAGASSAGAQARFYVEAFPEEGPRLGVPASPTEVVAVCYVRPTGGSPPDGWQAALDGRGKVVQWTSVCGNGVMGTPFPIDPRGYELLYVGVPLPPSGAYQSWVSQRVCDPPTRPCSGDVIIKAPLFAKWGSAKGRVLLSDGTPAPNIEVHALDRLTAREEGKATTGTDGRFDFATGLTRETAWTRHWVLPAVPLRVECRRDGGLGGLCTPTREDDPQCSCEFTEGRGKCESYYFLAGEANFAMSSPGAAMTGSKPPWAGSAAAGLENLICASENAQLTIWATARDLANAQGNYDPNRPGPGPNGTIGTGTDGRTGLCGTDLCQGSTDPNRGEPVNLRTGDVWFDQVDVSIMGRRMPLSLIRSYHSRDAVRPGGLFGRGWTANVEQRIVALNTQLVRLERAGGGATFFSDGDSDGTFLPLQPTSDDSTLQRTAAAWIRSLREGGTEEYDVTTGRCFLQNDLIGDQTRFNWTGNRLTSIVLPNGRTLTLGYTHDDSPATLSGPEGLIASYTYDPEHRLATVTYADGAPGSESGYAFTYDDKSQIEWVRDLYGRVIEHHTYDAQGRGLLSEGHDGLEKLTIDYLPDGNVVVTDATRVVDKYEFGDVGGGHRKLVSQTLCPDCPGGGDKVVTFDYDLSGRVEAVFDADDPTRKTEYRYDAANRLETVVDALGRETKLQYTDFLRLTNASLPGQPTQLAATITYEPQGPVSSKDAENRETTFGYTDGLLTTVTSPLQKTTTVHHDPVTGDVDWIEDADGRRVSFRYNGMGWRTNTKDALNRETVVTYDVRGRVTRVTRPDGLFSEVRYDHRANEVTMVGVDRRTTRYKYDDAGRLAAVRDALDAVTEYKYDKMSRLQTVRDDAGRETIFDYDKKGRLEQLTYPGGSSESFTYYPSGRLQTSRDRRNVVATYTYDALGRVLTKSFSDATPAIEYQYDDTIRRYEIKQGSRRIVRRTDKAGWLTSEEQPNGMVSYGYFDDGARQELKVDGTTLASYRYSDAGALRFIDSGSRTFEYVYDAVGRRDSLRYPNGIVADYTLDIGSQLQSLQVGVPGNPIQSWTFGRNANGSVKDRTAVGVDTSARSYRYDGVDRLIAEHQSAPAAKASVWSYDSVGNWLTSQDAMQVSTASHNERNQLLSSSAGGDLLVAGKTVPSSRVDLWMDAVDRPPSGTVTAVLAIAGEFEGTFPAVAPGTHTLTIEASAGEGRVARQRYDVHVTGQAATFAYDANGNMIGKTTPDHTWTYLWDSENRLRHVCRDVATCTPEVAAASFDYDPIGRRISKSSGGNTHSYLYDGADIVRETLTGLGAATFSYIHGSGVDEPLARRDSNGGLIYFHADDLGSVRLLTNDAAEVVHSYTYDPWGNISSESGPALGGVEYAFTGREWDRETGLYYYRARYYDPKAGRFVSEDPIGFEGGVNFYSYVNNRPTMHRDPSGLKAPDSLVTPEPDFWPSLIPVYGSVMQARHDFDTDQPVWGSVNTAMAVSDIFLVKSIAKGVAVGACKTGSHTWGATRRWLGKTGFAGKGQPVHHWFLERGEGLGKYVPDWIKNQPWNLMTLPDQATHIAIHGKGAQAMNIGEQLWFGTPQWFKAFFVSGATRGAEANRP
jgi:RHS repeat-associated protein